MNILLLDSNYFRIAICALLLCVVTVAAQKPACARREADNPVIIVGDTARFSVAGAECVRLEYSAAGEFVDAPSMFAVNRDYDYRGFTISEDGGTTIIDTGRIKLFYTPDGKPFSRSNLRAEIRKGDGTVEWRPGMANRGNLGGTIRTVDGVIGPVDLGEGILSRDGWYLIDDSRRHIFTDDWVAARPADSGTDWFLFGYGNDYIGALRALTAVGGAVPLPRRYALGAWYSRYWPYSQDDYRKIVKEYAKHDFPLDVMVLDMDWHKDGWTGWSWNRKLLPDAERLLKWFHEKDLFVTLNLHPADGVGPHEDMYADFMRDLDRDPAKKEWVKFDAGNKKYLDTLFKDVISPLEKEGVDFWWLDWQQYPYTRSIPELTNLRLLNYYFYQHTGQGGKRGLSFSRWAGWGDHRYPIHFSGDSHTGWPMLAFIVPFTSTAGNMGAFFWSHDIGGHMGPRMPETYTRWCQFGATTAALRSHSTRSPEQDRRPWKYPKYAENSMRVSFHLRSELFPYIYSTARQGHTFTMPLNRPMYLLYPEDERSYKNPQQYFFGDAFLAAPIVSAGVGKGKVAAQVVWFPEGVWYNWFTGERFEGDAEALVAADINEFPLYARGGTPVPMQPYTQRMSTTPLAELVVRVYPGADGTGGSYTLYEDDGVTNAYMRGEFAETGLSYFRDGDRMKLAVSPVDGVYDGQLKERAYAFQFANTDIASVATVNGKAADVEYDADRNMNIIRTGVMPITERIEVEIKAAETEQAAIVGVAARRRAGGILGGSAAVAPVAGRIAAYAETDDIDEKEMDMLLAVAGTGIFVKDERLYLYKNGRRQAYFYCRPGSVDGDTFSYRIEDRYGTETQAAAAGEMFVEAAGPLAIPALPPLKKSGGYGVRTSRVLIVDFSVGGHKFSIEKEIDSRQNYLTKWNIIGPFDFSRVKKIEVQNYGPEKDKLDLGAVYDGKSGEKVHWRRASAGEAGLVDLQKHFYIGRDNSVAYAVTFVLSQKDQPAGFKLNSDDGAEVWVNGEKIFTANGSRSLNAEPDEFTGRLKSGANIIMLKISQFNYDWSYKLGIGTLYPVKQSYGRK